MKKNDTSAVYRLIVIGGGAAGLYAGAAAGLLCPAFPKKHRGLILERKPEPGKKLMITGSGQCNITHSGSIKNFPAHYHEAGKKIRTLLYAHSNEQVVSTFASMGLRTFVREDGKIFPESLSARSEGHLKETLRKERFFHSDGSDVHRSDPSRQCGGKGQLLPLLPQQTCSDCGFRRRSCPLESHLRPQRISCGKCSRRRRRSFRAGNGFRRIFSPRTN